MTAIKTPAPPPPDDDTDWDRIAEMDPTIDMMRQVNMPITRENYIGVKYGAPGSEDYPKVWTDEHEMDLPGPLQRGDLTKE